MSNQARHDEISLKEFFIKCKEWGQYLLSKWMVILIVGLIGGVIGLVSSLISKPIYTANLSFALEDQQQSGGLSGALGLASQFGFDIGGSGGGVFTGANLIELFKSRRMVEQTLLRLDTSNHKGITLAEIFIQNAGWRKKWAKDSDLQKIRYAPNVAREQFTRLQDSVLGVIYLALSKNSLNVSQNDKSIDIITINVKHEDEHFAKYFAEALAEEVSDFYVSTRSKKARINMEILEHQTDSVRGELNSAITGVAVANDNTFGLNPALNVRRTPSARRQVDVQANTAILIELIKQTEIAKVAVRKETPLIQVIDRPILPLKKERLGKAKGIIIGGLLAGILVVTILLAKGIHKKMFDTDSPG